MKTLKDFCNSKIKHRVSKADCKIDIERDKGWYRK